jgi:hypothetical protein
MGTLGDGGYVVVDNGLAEYTSLLTMGICDDNSFEVEFNKLSNAYVQQYDYSIERPPVHIENSSFFKTMVKTKDDLVDDARLGSKRFLKIDIEGSEWGLLPTLDLSSYEQIVMELHMGQLNPSYKHSFENLTRNHHIVHVHGNSCDLKPTYYVNRDNLISFVPSCLEVTLLRKDLGVFSPNKTWYPTKLDYSCDTRPDWDLRMYPFAPHNT